MNGLRLFLIDRGIPIIPRTIPELEHRTQRIAKDTDRIFDTLDESANGVLEIRRGHIGLRKYFGNPKDVWVVGDFSGKGE